MNQLSPLLSNVKPWILLSICFSILYILQIKAQTPLIDSVLTQLPHMPEDTNKMYDLLLLGKEFLQLSDYDRSTQYLESGFKLATRLNHDKGLSIYYKRIGLVFWEKGDYDNAVTNLSKSLKFAEKLNDRDGIADNYHNIGSVYASQGNFKMAINNYLTALSYREDHERRDKSAHYTNLGSSYYELGDIPTALNYFLLSMQMDIEIGDKYDMAMSTNSVAIFYHDQQLYNEAISYYTQAVQYCKEAGNLRCIGSISTNLGVVYSDMGRHEEALAIYLESMKIHEQLGNKDKAITTYIQIGSTYRALKEYNLALLYYEKGLQTAMEINSPSMLAATYKNLGVLHMDLTQYEKAREYFIESLQLYIATGEKSETYQSYFQLARLDSIMGNYMEAFNHFKLYTFYKDSVLNETNLEAIAEIEKKYESEKKDKEILRLENEKEIDALQLQVKNESLSRMHSQQDKLHAENLFHLQQIDLQELELEKNKSDIAVQLAETEQQKAKLDLLNQQGEIKDLQIKRKTQLQLYTSLGFLLFSLLGLFIYSNIRTRQKLKLQMLRNKIASDLHDDVGSTLSSIALFSQMAQQQSKETIPLLNTIHDSSRKMLEAMADIVWTINPENDQFEKIVLRMMNFAFDLLGSKQIDYKFIADENIRQMKLPMEVRKNLYLIFKEATNNMVKYSDASKAHISLQEAKDVLTMEIRDNGKGFDPERVNAGNGLKNMKKRASDMGAHLRIESKQNEGTLIAISVAI